MAELITVMAAKANDRVVLWEVNPDHPGGEVFITGDGRSVQAALTAAIQRKLDGGELLRVGAIDSPTEEPVVEPVVEPQPAVLPAPVDGPPWEGYDAQSAAVIVERLAALTDDEKATVKAYEAAHKNRKTVLEA